MAIIGIVAIARNFAIGRNGQLPWHYSSDLKFFKKTTTGKAILMGRKTFDSIGKPLPNRLNIVLSRSSEPSFSHVIQVKSSEAIVELSAYLASDLFIIGGSSIYQEFSKDIDKWIVTEIPETISDADVFMPENFLAGFDLIESISLEENLNAKIYTRIKSAQ